MTFTARTGTLFDVSVGGLVKMMPFRTGLRSLLSLAVLSLLFVFAFAQFEDGGHIPWEFQGLGEHDLRSREDSQRSFAVRQELSSCARVV